MIGQAEGLVENGDQGAALALYLATARNLASGNLEHRARALLAASDSGYGLASFYSALHVKDQAGLAMTEASGAYRRFRKLLNLAQEQGLAAGIVNPVRSNVTPES